MGGRREPPARDNAASDERRERLRRDRERRRAAPRPTAKATPTATPTSEVASAPSRVKVRERHEGLVGWIARTVAAIPASVVGVLGSFALEVLTVVAAIGRVLLRSIPGVGRRSRSDRAAQAAVRRAPSVRRRNDTKQSRSAAAKPRTEAARRAANARRTMLRHRIQAALSIVLLASIVAAWIFVPRSDMFQIRHLQVTGAGAVSDLEVREGIDRMLAGKTVFTVDENAIADRIEELPFVRSVRVERHLPGGLELHVVEYRPLALGFGDGGFWLVARDGRILAEADRDQWEGRIPLVTLRSTDLKPGVRVGDEPALQLLGARTARSTLVFDVVEAKEFRLIAHLPSGIEIRFGRAEQLRQKVLAAETALAAARRAKVTPKYVDVSVPSRPAICSRDLTACGMARTAVDEAGESTEVGASTPEEIGGDEAIVGDDAGSLRSTL